jgi:hypothetical protein
MALTKAQIAAQNKKAKAKRVAFTEGQKWIDYISGKYGWLVSIYNNYPEVATIIKNGYINDEPVENISSKINNSSWARGLQVGEYDYLKGTSTNDRAYLDKLAAQEKLVIGEAAKGGYKLSDEQTKSLAASALKAGWSGPTLATEVGKAVVAGAKTGAQVSAGVPQGQAVTGLQKGVDAATVRSSARSYGINLSDQDVEGYVQSAITGELSSQQIEDQFRNQAKSLYPSLAKQLDAGNLDSAVSSYRSIAANTLGIDGTAIDFSDATKFGKLLTYQDPKSGEARLMNATEWTQYLRGLPEWQNTSEAKTGYDALIKSVETLFGKVG